MISPKLSMQFHVGEDWIPAILELHEKILKVEPNYRIAQVKEKFGFLEFYVDPISILNKERAEEIEILINDTRTNLGRRKND